jgi:perosamine synthetase
MSDAIIPVLRPSFGREEIDAVARVLNSGWAGLGPETAAFEREFAAYLGIEHAVGTATGTAALHLALLTLKLQPGDEVLVPPITFVSTVHAIEYCGATPVFVDVEPDTLNLDVKDAARKVTPRTKAILPVHYGGQPCDLDAVRGLAEPQGIAVVEDAAHACGASYKGRKIGTISELTCFSFHAVKNLAMGEGGAIACGDDYQDRFLREMRWMGISKDTFQRTVNAKVYAWQYWVDKLGWKAHLSDVAAAIGREQLKKLDANNARRRAIAERYTDAFRDLPHVEPLAVRDYADSSNHLYVVKLPDRLSRDRMIAHLKERGIAPGVHYYPIHLHPYYRHRKSGVPVASRIWERIVSLPIFPDLTADLQERVIEAVSSFPAPPRGEAVAVAARSAGGT